MARALRRKCPFRREMRGGIGGGGLCGLVASKEMVRNQKVDAAMRLGGGAAKKGSSWIPICGRTVAINSGAQLGR